MSNAAAPVPTSPVPASPSDGLQRPGAASPSLGQGVADVKAQFSAGAEAVREGLSSAVTHAKDRAYGLAEEQKQAASEGIDTIARAIHDTADGLRQQTPGVADYVDAAASGIGRASENLKSTSIDDVLHAVQSFARRQPVAFYVGAGLTGLLIGRLIQASGARRTVQRGPVRPMDDRDWPVGNRPSPSAGAATIVPRAGVEPIRGL